MKHLIAFLIVFLTAKTSFAQSLGINTDGSAPNSSAILDVSSVTKGMLVPRMTAAQRTAISPIATGLLVYQTDAPEGFIITMDQPLRGFILQIQVMFWP